MRVVLDTNVLVSGIGYPKSIPGRIMTSWRARRFEVTLSRYIFDEMTRVLPRLPQYARTSKETHELAKLFMFLSDVVEPIAVVEKRLRDKNDLPILGTLLVSDADYLITGDKGLLALSADYPILTPAEFWLRHGE